MGNAEFKERLDKTAAEARKLAEAMPAGVEREEMLMKARRAEMAVQFDEWASQPDPKKEK
jgi:hypothetical protein